MRDDPRGRHRRIPPAEGPAQAGRHRRIPPAARALEPHDRLTRGQGFGAIEAIVVAAILALMILVALPGLTGYQSTSAMQTASRQFVSDLRTAQEKAESLNTPITVAFTAGAGTAVTGYSVANSGAVLWSATFPSTVHATSSWPGLAITFQSSGSVSGSGTATALCIDNTRGLTATVTIAASTGHAALTNGSGSC